MRFDWYADLVFAAQVVHEVYGGSLAMIALDAAFDRVRQWQAGQPAPERCGRWAVRVWSGEVLPATFPLDGRDVYRYGFATALAPRVMQSSCCLCSARRILHREPTGVARGRGRGRPLLIEWRHGAQAALTTADIGWRGACALMDDLDRALREVAAEQSLGTAAELVPRSQLRALSGVSPEVARAVFGTARRRTAAALARRVGKAGEVPQK